MDGHSEGLVESVLGADKKPAPRQKRWNGWLILLLWLVGLMMSYEIVCIPGAPFNVFFGLDQKHDVAQKRPETWRQKPKNTTQKMQNMTHKMQNPTPNLCPNKFTQKFEETKK